MTTSFAESKCEETANLGEGLLESYSFKWGISFGVNLLLVFGFILLLFEFLLGQLFFFLLLSSFQRIVLYTSDLLYHVFNRGYD